MIINNLFVPLVMLVVIFVLYAVLYNSLLLDLQKLKKLAENASNSKHQEILIKVRNRTDPEKEKIRQSLKKCSNRFKGRLYHIENITNLEINNYIDNNCYTKKEQCKMEKLVGNSAVNLYNVTLDWLYQNELQFVRQGGWYAPSGCSERQSTAIIIPFRKREGHLPIFLRKLHPLLKRQQLHYRIFVIEQNDNSNFNRGKLMNIGFNFSQEFFPYNCFVFHDVDLVPEDDRIDYGCRNSPTHLTVAINTRGYKLRYATSFGGAEMFTKVDYEKINGYSNSFWYWGGEDDNLYFRTKENKMHIHRQSAAIARYTAILHLRSTEQIPKAKKELFRVKANPYNKKDGLNTLQYKVLEVKAEPLYTLIKVNLRKERDRLYGVLHKFEN